MTATIGETATLAHGYSMTDIDTCARQAYWVTGRARLDPQDGIDYAWHAIVELLYTSTERPGRDHLVNAGKFAILDALTEEAHAHGFSFKTNATRPAFEKYWRHHLADQDDFTDRIIERLALPQVLGQLTDRQYEAVAALAAHGDLKTAAAALGISHGALFDRVRMARLKVAALWEAPETPRSTAGTRNGPTCRSGHARAQHSYKNADGWWVCRICSRNKERRRRARDGAFVKA